LTNLSSQSTLSLLNQLLLGIGEAEMPIAITKQKAAKVLKEQEEQEEQQSLLGMTIEELVDKYGALKEESEELLKNPVIAEFESVQKELKSRLKAEMDVTDEAEIVGERYLMEVSACSKSPRKLDADKMAEIEKALGREVFLKLAKLAMKDLEQYLGKAMIDKFLDKEVTYTETRKLLVRKI